MSSALRQAQGDAQGVYLLLDSRKATRHPERPPASRGTSAGRKGALCATEVEGCTDIEHPSTPHTPMLRSSALRQAQGVPVFLYSQQWPVILSEAPARLFSSTEAGGKDLIHVDSIALEIQSSRSFGRPERPQSSIRQESKDSLRMGIVLS